MRFAILIPISYLIGSIPFGFLIGLSRGVDVRTAGSGNIGASNVGRLLGKKYFYLTMLLDMLKSLVPMAVASYLVHRDIRSLDWETYLLWLAVGFAAVLGHMFSVFLKFKGGKGVATSAGLMLGLYPYLTFPGVIGVSVFVVMLLVGDMVSLASITAACAFPLIYVAIGLLEGWPVFQSQLPLLIFAVIMAVLITLKHRSNISRIRAGTENKFRKKPPAPLQNAA
jgi:acyl phosphate:glycerol-3-phosphate acyltransferase